MLSTTPSFSESVRSIRSPYATSPCGLTIGDVAGRDDRCRSCGPTPPCRRAVGCPRGTCARRRSRSPPRRSKSYSSVAALKSTWSAASGAAAGVRRRRLRRHGPADPAHCAGSSEQRQHGRASCQNPFTRHPATLAAVIGLVAAYRTGCAGAQSALSIAAASGLEPPANAVTECLMKIEFAADRPQADVAGPAGRKGRPVARRLRRARRRRAALDRGCRQGRRGSKAKRGQWPRRSSLPVTASLAWCCSASATAARADYERAGGALTARFLTSGVTSAAVDFAALGGQPTAKAVARFAAAAAQRAWRIDTYRTKLPDKQKPTLATITLVNAPDGAEAGWATQDALTKGLALTRTLVSEPPNIIYPESFVECVPQGRRGARARGHRARRGRDGRRSAWARCSASARGRCATRSCSRSSGTGRARAIPTVALVGKGVTFDTGGISHQARRRHGRHEVGHGRRGRGRRRDEGARRRARRRPT